MSPVSMDTYLRVVSPHLAPVLVDEEAWSRLHAVAALLPPCSLAGLELRLRENQPKVDFFVRLSYFDPALPPAFLAHPVWRALQRVCEHVARPSGRLHGHVSRLFLEFDLDAPPSSVPTPGLFLVLDTSRTVVPSEMLAIADALGLFKPNAGMSEATLDRCMAALPPAAKLAHIGFMLSRPGHAVRLVIERMPASAVSQYLDEVGWRDPARQLSEVVGDLAGRADAVVMLDLDVADEVCPGVGVEFYVRRETDNVPRWRALLARLVERGFASPTKVEALLAWPGFTGRRNDGESWPPNLEAGDLAFRGLARSLFWRNLNHVKLGYRPGREPEAKIYLGFGHNWFPIGTPADSE
ncbi:MAG TPA: hypothetical protein PLH72_03135 [Vicinamibacterales bacterium]|nr:hypothetical protein [Vicinamibacterales bacterium]